MRTHVSIMAHAEAKDTFLRHFPYWKMQTESLDHIMAWMPEDGKFQIDGLTYQTVGKRQHHGPQALLRFRYMLEFLNGMDYDRFLIYEYDSFSLEHVRIFPEEFAGNLFPEPNAGKSFLSPIYSHPPLVFSKVGLKKVCAEFRQMPEQESGFWDRWLGLAIHRAGLTTRSFMIDGTGFSLNTIHPDHYPQVHNAIMKGAVHIHGVKDEPCRKVVDRSYNRRRIILEAEAIKLEEGL